MKQLKILVVDDESRMRKLVGDFLKKSGYQVWEASDGSEALDVFFEQKDIALVILDVICQNLMAGRFAKKSDSIQKFPLLC